MVIKNQLQWLDVSTDDRCVWTASMDGRFSIKSAWDIC